MYITQMYLEINCTIVITIIVVTYSIYQINYYHGKYYAVNILFVDTINI